MNKEFDAWARKIGKDVHRHPEGMLKDTYTLCAEQGWQARQPEIDALNAALAKWMEGGKRIDLKLAEVEEAANQLISENAALKTEVERLRQRMDAPSFFLLGLSGSPNVPKTFREAALMHHESLDAAMKKGAT